MSGTSSILQVVTALTALTAHRVDLPQPLRSGNFVSRSDSADFIWVSVDDRKTWDRYDIGDDSYWEPAETTDDSTMPSNYIHHVWVYGNSGTNYFAIKNPTYWG
jgi:hypothetical protein